MKNKVLISLIIIGLLLFTILYSFILIKIDYGVMPYDEYYGVGDYDKPPCEFKHLENDYTQLPNCAKYKFKGVKT